MASFETRPCSSKLVPPLEKSPALPADRPAATVERGGLRRPGAAEGGRARTVPIEPQRSPSGSREARHRHATEVLKRDASDCINLQRPVLSFFPAFLR